MSTYDAHPALRQSDAKLLLDCPARFKQERKETRAFSFGAALHDAVIFQKNNIKLSPAERKKLDAMTPVAGAIFDKTFKDTTDQCEEVIVEEPIFFTYHAVECKAKPDYLIRRRDGTVDVYDLKSTKSCHPSSFKRSTVAYGYDFQAAWYLEAIKSKYPDAREIRFHFLAVEKSLQPLATCFTASELFLNEGRAKNKRALDIYKKCTAENSWPDYNANGPVLLTPDYITAQQLEGVEDDE